MLNLKKVAAFAMAAVLTLAQPMTALASTDGSSTTAGTANILDYSVDTVVIPTKLTMMLNPQGLELPVLKEQLTSVSGLDATKYNYYEKDLNDGSYNKLAAASLSSITTSNMKAHFRSKATTDQVISLNYGILNRSSKAKNVKISIEASRKDAVENKDKIEFVDAATKAQTNVITDTALKMYLAVVTSSDTPSALTVERSLITTTSAYGTATGAANGAQVSDKVFTKTYTTKEQRHSAAYKAFTGTAADAVTAGEVFVRKYLDYFTPDTRAYEISDVKMTKATAITTGSVFAGTGATAKAEIGVNLPKATYGIKEREKLNISETTTQDEFQKMVELTNVGGYTGFTITGSVNSNADWTNGEAKALVFTPVYKIEDAVNPVTPITGTVHQIGIDKFSPIIDGYAKVVAVEGANYLGLLKGSSGTDDDKFTGTASDISSVKVNGVDVTSKAIMLYGHVAVKASDLSAAGIALSGSLDTTYVVAGETYHAVYTF